MSPIRNTRKTEPLSRNLAASVGDGSTATGVGVQDLKARPVGSSRLAQAGCLAEVKGMIMRMVEEASLNKPLIDTVM